MESKLNIVQEGKTIFQNLKTDGKSVLFSQEKLKLKFLKKLKHLSYVGDKKLLKLINIAETSIEEFNEAGCKIPIRLDYVEEKETDRSNFYSFNGPFQLVPADIANLEFLSKSPTTAKYALLMVDLC